jgi:hypothetical protein
MNNPQFKLVFFCNNVPVLPEPDNLGIYSKGILSLTKSENHNYETKKITLIDFISMYIFGELDDSNTYTYPKITQKNMKYMKNILNDLDMKSTNNFDEKKSYTCYYKCSSDNDLHYLLPMYELIITENFTGQLYNIHNHDTYQKLKIFPFKSEFDDDRNQISDSEKNAYIRVLIENYKNYSLSSSL